MEIWWSSDKNNFAQFFWDMVYIHSTLMHLIMIIIMRFTDCHTWSYRDNISSALQLSRTNPLTQSQILTMKLTKKLVYSTHIYIYSNCYMLLNTEQIPVIMYGFQRTRGMSTLPCWTASVAAAATSIVICTDGCIYNWSSYIPTQPAQLSVERCNNKSQKAATQIVQCNLTEFSLKQALLNKIMNAILTWEFGWKTIQNASSKVLLHTLAVSIFKYTIR